MDFKMDLNKLKEEMPFKWKVQTANAWGCDFVAYVDARQVMDKLDDVVGVDNWSDEYIEKDGKLFCRLSINVDGSGSWVSKEDCGTESAFDVEKGQVSDAFKRAAVKWGIGRFLYSKTMVKSFSVDKNANNDKNNKKQYVPTAVQGSMDKNHLLNTPSKVNRWIELYLECGENQWEASKKWISSNSVGYKNNSGNNSEAEASLKQKELIQNLCRKKDIDSSSLKVILTDNNMKWKTLTSKEASKLIKILS